MSISNDLFRAILAMDAYNRGYNPSVVITGSQSNIGNATLGIGSSTNPTSNEYAASFYAQSYTWNGQTIISYRGSDSLRPMWTGGTVPSDIPYWDIWFLRNYNNDQAKLAAEFYKQVLAANPSTAIETTGHSLGGALAGFVSALYGLKGTLFDNIGFMEAARLLYGNATNTYSSIDPQGFYDLAAKNYFYGSGTPPALNFANISGYWIDGEIAGIFTRTSEEAALLSKLSIGSASGYISPIDLHSQAYLVTMMFGNELANQNWQKIAKELTLALFDHDVAQKAGASALAGGLVSVQKYADALQNAIAYSAIDQGTRVFGDTGIRALFDDANDIGTVLGFTDASKTVKAVAAAIAKIIVQFGGHLAVDKVLTSSTIVPVTDGVLALSSDQKTLSIDFSDALWSAGTSSSTAPADIVGRTEIIKAAFSSYFSGAPGQQASSDILGGMKWLWNNDGNSIFDRFVFATHDGATTTALASRGYTSSQVTMFAAGGSDDIVAGSGDDEFIFGGDGADTIRGGDGKDLIAGGNGNDRLTGGEGRDFIAGGAGTDTIFYEVAPDTGLELNIRGVADAASNSVPTLELSTSTSNVDRVLGVENIELTNARDTVRVGSGLEKLSDKIRIDAGGQASGERDVLDFSSLSGVSIKQNSDGIYASSGLFRDLIGKPSVAYKNFE